MRMHTRRLCAAAFLLTASVLAVSAQGVPAGTVAASPPPLVTIQMGYDVGYNVGTSSVGNSFDMSLILGLTDNLQVGVSFLSGGTAAFASYQLIELYYTVLPKLGAVISMGSTVPAGPSPVVGLGVYSNVLGKDVQGSMQTGLRLLVDYLAPLGTSFNTGTIRLGVMAWVGM
jgi:hypothetical protein